MEQETNVDEVTVEDELEDNETDNESGTDETESGEESEVEDSETLSDDDGSPSETEARQERAKSQISRLKEEKAKLKEENERLRQSGQGSSEVETNTDLMERTFLAANGYHDKEVQAEMLRLAHRIGIPVHEILEDADIKGRADNLIKRKKAQKAIAKGTGGALSKSKGVSHYVEHFNRTGEFPAGTPNSMIAKVTDQLAKQ